MATTDSNDILFYEDTDAVSPLHTLLNTGQTSVTNAVSALKNGSGGEIIIHYVADIAERAALTVTYSPTASNPLYVHRGDATVGSKLEVTEDGTTWRWAAPTMQKGDTTCPAVGAGWTGTVAPVTFPVAFPGVPEVILRDSGGRLLFWGTTVTATGFSTGVLNVSTEASGSGQIIRWIALYTG